MMTRIALDPSPEELNELDFSHEDDRPRCPRHHRRLTRTPQGYRCTVRGCGRNADEEN